MGNDIPYWGWFTQRTMVLEYLQSQHLPERPKSPSFVGKYTTHGASGLGYFYMSFSTNKNIPVKKYPRISTVCKWPDAFLTKIAVYENGAEKNTSMGRNENEPSCKPSVFCDPFQDKPWRHVLTYELGKALHQSMHGHSGDIGHHNTSSWRANPQWLMGFFYDLPMLPGGKTMKNQEKKHVMVEKP